MSVFVFVCLCLCFVCMFDCLGACLCSQNPNISCVCIYVCSCVCVCVCVCVCKFVCLFVWGASLFMQGNSLMVGCKKSFIGNHDHTHVINNWKKNALATSNNFVLNPFSYFLTTILL